jgi:ABC-2 type transport system ATP-binding protein
MIRVKGLCRHFSTRVALDEITFQVEPGEAVGLLGPNGAGKTTLMRILTGFMPQSAGTVQVGGMTFPEQRRQIHSMMGYLPEGVPCYSELRVAEHLLFFARLRRLTGARRRQEVNRVIEACGLQEARRTIVGHLSKGYRQRLGLAAVLLGDPSLLILDEPTVGLDPNQAREIRQLISTLTGSHTILLSTHLLAEVEALCSKVVILNRGQLVAQGPLQTLRRAVGTGELRLSVRGPVEAVTAALGLISGVTEVEILEPRPVLRLRLRGELSPDTREQVATALHEGGWALQELHFQEATLDEIFNQLTRESP